MTTTYQQYFGKFTCDADNKNLSVAANPIVLTEGDYYIAGYTGEEDQFIETLEDAIQALGGAYAAATVTYSSSTGKITIDFDGTTTTITWTDSALQTLLGFTGSQSGASSYTATYQPKYVWRPTLALSYYPCDLDQWWEQVSSTRVTISIDGTTYSNVGNLLYGGDFAYSNLPKADVIDDAATSFRRFWTDVVHAGMPVRCYPDRTENGASDFHTAMILPPGADRGGTIEIGSFHDFKNRFTQTYNGAWDVKFALAKYVT